MDISVQCRADSVDEEIPSRLIMDGRELDVVEVIDRWLATDHRYFKVRTLDGQEDIEDPIGGDKALYVRVAQQIKSLLEQRLSQDVS